MKPKLICKISIDFLMTALLLVMMAFQVTGRSLHECIGTGMLLLFLLHNILNFRWYKNLFKGKYTPVRILRTIINFLALAAMICLAVSGIIMSKYVFGFLSIHRGMSFARRLHLAASHWGFVLMSMHLGLHWGMVIAAVRKLTNKKLPNACVWFLRAAGAAAAVYGAVCFYQANFFSYLFIKRQFAFFDFRQNPVLVFAKNISMMDLWAFAAYYAAKLTQIPRLQNGNRKQ